EVAAGADQRQAAEERLTLVLPEADARVRAHHPGALRLVEVDGRVAKGAAPLDHRGVVVRVRDRDLRDPAQLLDPRDRRLVDQPDAVPEEVAFGRLDQEGPLADAELRLGIDRVEPLFFLLDRVPVRPAEALERRPLLTVRADVLPLVLANRAML